jgi:hypothetical protein
VLDRCEAGKRNFCLTGGGKIFPGENVNDVVLVILLNSYIIYLLCITFTINHFNNIIVILHYYYYSLLLLLINDLILIMLIKL